MKHIEDKLDKARDNLDLANRAWDALDGKIGYEGEVNCQIRHGVYSLIAKATTHLNTLLIEYHTDSNFEGDIVNLVVWSRDCDGVEATRLHKLPATIEAYNSFEHNMYEDAEGSWEMEIISPEEAESFEPHFRDRYAEMEGY